MKMPVVSSSSSSCLGLVLTAPSSCRLPSAKVVQVMGSSSSSCYEKRYINNINMKEKAENNNSCLAGRRELAAAALVLWLPAAAALSASDEEYVKETSEVIKKVRRTIGMDKTDPNVASAVAELRDASNSWVAKYRREKALLGRVSFRDMYSALNAVSGHYISFGPTAPIPAKRKARILEEVDTAEKALLRGR